VRAFWLLRLSRTNAVDLELASAVFEKYGLESYVIGLLKSQEALLTLPLQKTYLRALFNAGRAAEFDAFSRSLPSGERLLADLEMQLYRAAFVEGWGSVSREAAFRNDHGAGITNAAAGEFRETKPLERVRKLRGVLRRGILAVAKAARSEHPHRGL